MDPAATVMERLEALGQISDDPDGLTRLFASPAMGRANEMVAHWMQAAGLVTRRDALGNLIGHRPGPKSNGKTLLIGSHLDTVRHAGKYDGPLGVILAIEAIHSLKNPPCALEVIAFADEEGARYQTAYLGSRAITGQLTARDLARTDANGISVADAIRAFGGNPNQLDTCQINFKNLLGYVEVHIEQGPVLEKMDQAVGVVTAIAGQTRARLQFDGQPGHAGTTPMNLRQDALCAAAEFVTATENYARQIDGLVATVGQLQVQPNISNVIPGRVQLTLDLRHQLDATRVTGCDHLQNLARMIAGRRQLKFEWSVVQETAAVPCSKDLSEQMARAVQRHQSQIIHLPSGAGHDAAIMASITPVAMLFVRCAGGLSHHPDESVRVEDVRVALQVLTDFIQSLPARA